MLAPAKTPADLIRGLSPESLACVQCHEKSATPVVVQQWLTSRHAQNGVGCYECHQADKSYPDAFQHNGYVISLLVTPKDCGVCHDQEAKGFEASYHAKAGEILGWLDNVLGEVVEGVPAVNSGCKQCHGGTVKVLDGGKLDAATWPNSGIGRINPDGSRGSCAACHGRHTSRPPSPASPRTAASAPWAQTTRRPRSMRRASTASPSGPRSTR